MKRALFPLIASVLVALLLWQSFPGLIGDPSGIELPEPPTLQDDRGLLIDIARAEDVENTVISDELLRIREVLPLAIDTPPAQLTVLVRRPDGRPLEDVAVILAPPLVVDARTDERVGVTGRDGTIEFSLPPGSWRCRTVLGVNAELELAADERRALELTLPKDPAVRGIVTDERGAPIASATVLVLGLSTLGIARSGARTGPDGSFELLGIGAGRLLAAAHPDFAPCQPQRVELADAEAPTITLVLRRPHGVLLGDVTDTEGKGLPGAVVWFGPRSQPSPASILGADAPQSGPPAQVVRADEHGHFVSPALPLGEIEVRALATGFALGRTFATVAAGASSALRIVLDSGARLEGIVRHPDGTPAADAIVYSGIRRSIGSRLARTQVDGSFALTSLPTHAIEVTALGLAANGVTTQQAATLIQLRAGETLGWNPTLLPQPRGSVRGKLEDQQGQPLAGWLVMATPQGQRRGLGTETASDGTFSLLGLPTLQTVDVSARRPSGGWNSFVDGVQKSVVVDGSPVTITVVYPAPDRCTLLGVALDEGGRPLTANIHMLHGRGEVAQYPTRLDGSFRIDTVPAGTVNLELRHPNYPPLRLPPLQLEAQEVRDLGTLQLRQGGIAFGRILGPLDQPPTNVTMRLIDSGDREIATADCTDLGYRTPWLQPGDYDLLVQADSTAPSRVPVSIQAGQEHELNIRLEPGSLHRLRVRTGVDSDRSAQVSVVVFDDQQRAVWVAHLPMTQGTAEFRCYLRDGPFAVLALGVRGYRATGSFAVDARSPAGPGLTELELQH